MTDPTRSAESELPTEPYTGPADDILVSVGRYRIVRELGRGGFGVVYLGHDDRLNRPVAVKVPHPRLVSTPADAQAYLNEARTVANLEHPNIVTVFDTDATEQHPCFVVSQYIDGSDLSRRAKLAPLTVGEAVELVATVAEALHFAHTRGVVHRDVKPANLLLSRDGVPFVGDFGVALREQDVGRGPRYAGTPAYMSPEQARGEGHRVDGRSDVFALGVVLYELLVGRRPFKGDTREELLAVIAESEPRPPRQVRDAIPRELERICLRALAKRVSERYTTAADLAADLRQFHAADRTITPTVSPVQLPPVGPTPVPAPTPIPLPPSDTGPLAVVPKGLRSFDAADADFFLSLLPGPRDRDGLPDSLRFWKRWAETTDRDSGAGVGLIYGPSGCGKTSLMRAGLIPRLAGSVIPVYIEAAPDDTEQRLLAALRKQVPDLPVLSLVDTLTALRQGRFLPAGRTVLLVIDQFEQWLHAHPKERLTDLALALRQCDGHRLRCVLMVRDDFWLAVSRFMRLLEVRIEEDRNARLVDLFDRLHARKVLTAFGRAYGCLPDGMGELSDANTAFLDRAVDGLAEGDKVVSVRLALFAQMVKGKEWTPATLDAVGGAQGVGVTFLEESFAGRTAPLANRVHAKAAQAILTALLPEGAAGIKGARRSERELLAASGYAVGSTDFADVLRLLDADLRLITPTDTEGGERHFQLTHDFLVPSLHEWLTRKQRETRRGRAELLLAERAGEWVVRPDARWLPTLGEWLAVRFRTVKRNWTDPQRRMMRSAAFHHGRRVGLWALGVLLTGGLLFAGGAELFAQRDAAHARESLRSASVADLENALDDLEQYRSRVERQLRDEFDTADPPHKLRLALALARWDSAYCSYLHERLLDVPPDEFKMVRQELGRHPTGELTDLLWKQVGDSTLDSGKRLRAACALAVFDPKNSQWSGLAKPTVDRLLVQNPAEVEAWGKLLSGVNDKLLPPLTEVICDSQSDPTVAQTATNVFRQYAKPEDYAPLERVATTDTVFLAIFAGGGSCTDTPLGQLRRRANAAAALVACGQGERVWGLLVHTPDPTLRSLLIERLAATHTPPDILMVRLKAEPDVSARRALILALGSYPADYSIADDSYLLSLFENDPDAGIHGASEWAARQRRRQKEVDALTAKLADGKLRGGWFVSKSGITFSVIEPTSPLLLPDGRKLHVPHRYAIATKEVTWRQWAAMKMSLPVGMEPEDRPVSGVSWYEMAEFCNRLNAAEKIPVDRWCYLTNPTGEYAHGMMMLDHRKHTGFRLPHYEEWECAGRAGATTASHCGIPDDSLLVAYARYYRNSTRGNETPAFGGTLKPNDYGLFDIHGNVSERDHPFNVHISGIGGDRIIGGTAWQVISNEAPLLTAAGGNVNSLISAVGTQFSGMSGSPSGRNHATGFRLAFALE